MSDSPEPALASLSKVLVRRVRSGSKTEAETLKEAGGETGFVLKDGKAWGFSLIYGECEWLGCWLRWQVWTELQFPLKESKNSQFSRDKRPQGGAALATANLSHP